MTIGLIAEGITDQMVLEQIVSGYFDGSDCLDINPLQPMRDATDRSEHDRGGWSNLIDYCSDQSRFDTAASVSDVLILQIDTDIFENLEIDETGQESVLELIDLVKTHLINRIGEQSYDAYSDKILFAIPVREIECWVLAAHSMKKSEGNKKSGCLKALNKILNSKLGKTIDGSKKDHFSGFYSELAKPFLKRKNLLKIQTKNESLGHFYNDMDTMFRNLDPCLDASEQLI